MKRRTRRRFRKRNGFRQQILRKEEKRMAKYPIHVIYGSAVTTRLSRNRGA